MQLKFDEPLQSYPSPFSDRQLRNIESRFFNTGAVNRNYDSAKSGEVLA